MAADRSLSAKRILVVAALIQRADELLVCQRKKGDSFALKWEFPGGKVQDGEAPAAALARELREELGVDSRIGDQVYRTCHRYAGHPGEVELIFFSASLSDLASIRNLAFETIEWAPLQTLPGYDFLPADGELIELLASGRLRLPAT